MGFICFLGAALFLAMEILPFFDSGGEDDLLSKRMGLAVLLSFAILIGTNWVLAFAKLFSEGALWACMVGFIALGGGSRLFRRRSHERRKSPLDLKPIEFLILGLFVLSITYLCFRGSLVWVAEYDALTYHFPKAVEVIRAHGIPHIPSSDFRVVYFPWNYELLLANGLLLTPGDGLSFLIGLAATFGLVAYGHAIFREAWPQATRKEAFLGDLVVCATPILIMQAADYKNDVLFSFFLLSFFYWIARWCQKGLAKELALAILSLVLCFGTKATALFVLPVFAAVIWHYRSRFTLNAMGGIRKVVPVAIGVVLIFLLMGSGWPLLNKLWCGHFLGDTAMVGGKSGFEANAVPSYIGFSNLWKFPLLAILRPFSSKPDAVWVFWKHQYWWWPGNHPIYGHFGWLCSLSLLAVPFGVLQHRKSKGESESFRLVLSLSILVFVFLSLPQRYRVDGMFCGFPRSLLCIPVLVSLWSVLPLLIWLRERGRTFLWRGLGLVLALSFSSQAYFYLRNDETKSFGLVMSAVEHPDLRFVNGVGDVIDKIAGPSDVIAFDSGFGGMVYRLYGAQLNRPVVFLQPKSGVFQIPAEAKWVVIDRSWNVGWSHPGVQDTSEFWLPTKRDPTDEDSVLVMQLSQDPAFALVYNDPANDQAIFLRRVPPPTIGRAKD